MDGRGTTISVVLLQNKNSFPTGEFLLFKFEFLNKLSFRFLVDEVYSSERDQLANTLCNSLEISKRSLCVLPVLPQPDNLSAWIDR